MSGFTPVMNKTNSDLVSEQLTELILNGQYPPSSRLPNEADLAKLFRVGRSTVREALKALQAAGILTSTAGRGTFVSENALSCLQLSRFSKMIITPEQSKDLAELRFSLEPDMARLAALRWKDKDVKAMQSCIDAMKGAATKSELLQHGNSFHRAVCKSTYNNMMIALHYSMSMQLLKLRQADFLTLEVYQRGISAHQGILDAIVARDAEEAEARMKAHLLFEYSRYLE